MLIPSSYYYCFMNSINNRIGTQSSMGPVGFEPFYKVGPVIELLLNQKSIPSGYPQLQGKIEVYNKIVKHEFLTIENSTNIEDGKEIVIHVCQCIQLRNNVCGIDGNTLYEMFIMKQ